MYPHRLKAGALAQRGWCSRTSSRSDQPSTERTTPPSSAHVQPDDVPRTPIQPSVEGEFRQHDGVVTMMMFYRRRASPKHRYSIIEVDYGGGGHRTRLKDQTINCCVSRVPPALVYKEARGKVRPTRRGTPGGVLLPPGVGLPPFSLLD